MRRVLMAATLMMLGACVSTSGRPSGAARGGTAPSAGGAATPKAAVEGFLAAAKNQDLQAMSALWGTEKGLARDQMSRDDLEKRLVIMQCNLSHDSWSFTPEPIRMMSSGEQDIHVELRQKTLRAQTVVTAVQGVGTRWYVKNVDLAPLSQFCR